MKKITILILLISSMVIAQDAKTISGVVLDEFDMPIAGASVYASSNIISNSTSIENTIVSSMLGSTTDLDGYFEFKAPSNTKTIIVSFIGFKLQQIDVSRVSTNLIVNLKEDNIELFEVVVTGYQKIEKRKATSSYKNLEIGNIKQVSIPIIDQMLAGQVSGVSVAPTNGAPGAPAKIRIRGITTLNGSSDPLWVVDGIPLEGNLVPENIDKDNIDNLNSYPIAGVNPEDIESITVLKDASATSIYGARAANGVIVITTKNGKEGDLSINFSANTLVTPKPSFGNLNLMNASEKVDFELLLASRPDLTYHSQRGEVARILNQLNEYDTFQNNGFNALSNEAKSRINTLRGINTNWGDALFRSAISSNYNLSLSGGNDKSDYYVSLGYFNQEGNAKKTKFDRYNITIKNNFKISDKFNVRASLFANRNINTSYVIGSDSYTNPITYIRNVNPYLKLKDKDGNYVYDPDLFEANENTFRLDYNVLEEQNNTSYELISNSIRPMLELDYELVKDLKVSTQLGLQFDFDNTERISQQDSYYTRKYRIKSRYYNPDINRDDFYMPDGGIIENWDTSLFQYNWKTLVNYNASFSTLHEVDVMLGTEFRKNKRKMVNTRGFGYNPNTLKTLPVIVPEDINKSNNLFNTSNHLIEENAFTSFFSTASYTYDNKYTIFGSLRYDGSNLFGVNPKYRYLPIWSVAGTWNVSRENFMNNIEFIDEFKIRGSYGVQGNIDRTTSPFVIGAYFQEEILPGQVEDLLRVDEAPNKNLRWEKTVSTNIGFDLGLFENRIYLVGDYYRRKSTDLIGIKSAPLESGFGYLSTNWASITNEGYELGISTKNIDKENFKWTTNFNISHNKNIVDRVQIFEDASKPSLEGYSATSVFGIKTAGVDNNGLPIFIKNGKQITAVDFLNLNQGTDGTQLTREQHRNLYTYIGDASPKYTGGFINNFTYKNLSLQVSTNFNLFRTVKEAPFYHPTYVEPGYNYNKETFKAGTGSYPALIGLSTPGLQTKLVYNWYNNGDDYNTYKDLDIWIKELSFIRVNNIRLSYAFEKDLLQSLGLQSFNIALEGRNLFVFGSDYKGYFDPETYGNPYAQPIPKTISLGFNVKF